MKRVIKKTGGDIGSIPMLQYNDQSGSQKQINAGPVLEILGTLAAAKHVKAGSTIYVYNSAGATGYVSTWLPSETPVAPTGLTDGIAIPPNSYMWIGMGTDTKIIGSAATLGAYRLVDDTVITEDKVP